MTTASRFINRKPRVLPVFVLADCSSSMKGEKMEVLNQALREMIRNFQEPDSRGVISLAVITFGLGVHLRLPLTVAKHISWAEDLVAADATPLGGALQLAADQLAKLSERELRPVLVLASDGQPTDEWRRPLGSLNLSEAGEKADRLALAIGSDANEAMLNEFVDYARKRRGQAVGKVYRAEKVSRIREFFEYATFISKKRGTTGSDIVVEDDHAPEMKPWDR